jgi:hypothetical protein
MTGDEIVARAAGDPAGTCRTRPTAGEGFEPMRKLSLVAGLLLALAAASSTMAAAPAMRAVASAAPAVTATTLTWKSSYSKSPIAGTAKLSGSSTYSSDKVSIKATGIKKGATVTFKIFDKVGTKFHTLALMTVTATLNSSHQLVRTWTLTPTQRAALKTAESHAYPVYFRLTDGSTKATGQLKKA